MIEHGFRPTLLVGVGGTGSRVAEKILRRLKNDSIKRATEVGILCFDTDLNDIELLQEVERRDVVQFSNNLKVYRLLDRNPSVESSWMPARHVELHDDFLSMDMIDGAKQIRMLTRLALWDSFAHSDIYAKMQSAVARMAEHSQSGKYYQEINILVFGSFAGATGSGSFLQIALALRNAARERGVSCKVRGMFTLPDVYARSNAIPRDQIPNVLANGYASLKELNAVNVLVSRPERNARFNFEYMPGEQVRPHEMPYDFMTFIDFESTNGGNMGTALANYEEMVARSGYSMIFTPLGAKFATSVVNNTLQNLEAAEQGTHNLYSGIGVAAVAYPADSTKEYLKLRLVHENLKGDCTRLDQMFREAMANFQKAEAQGGTQAEPDIVKTYVDNLRNLAQDDNLAFFRRIWDRLHPEVADEKSPTPEVVPRHITYLDALFKQVKSAFWNSSRLEDAKDRQQMDETIFKNKKKIQFNVKQMEQWLDEDYGNIDRELAGRPEEIFRNTMISSDEMSEQEWRAHHIQSYLIKDGPHPVEVRAFLYLLRQEIDERLGAINTKTMRKNLFNLANPFRTEEELRESKGEPAVRSTPNVHKLAAEAAGGGKFFGVFGGKSEEFGARFTQYYNGSLRQFTTYSDGMIAEKLLLRLRDEVDALTRVFFGLFNEVETIGNELKREIEIERDRYAKDGAINDGSVWIYADRACREDAWERLQDMAAGLKLDANVNKSVVKNVYEKYRRDQRDKRKSSFADINAMFRREVVETFGKNAIEEDFRGAHDFTVIEALRRQEAVRMRQDDTDATGVSRGRTEEEEQQALVDLLREAADRVARQSEPYLSLTNRDSDGMPIKYWALNPKIRTELNSDRAFTDVFNFSQEDKPLEAEDFSPYELLCVNLRVNLKLEDLKKLHHGDGSEKSVLATEEGRLYKEYKLRVDDLVKAQANADGPVGKFTPHIDKNWHKRGGLPEIFSSQEPGIENEQNKAYAAAMCLKMLKFESEYGDKVTRFDMGGNALRNSFDEVLVQSHDIWSVYQAFVEEPHIVSATNEGWATIAARGDTLEKSEGYKALLNDKNVARLFEISSIRKNEAERDQKTGQVLSAWMDLVADLVNEQRADMGEPGRVKLVQKLVGETGKRVISMFRSAGIAPETVRIYEREFNGAFDKRFQE